MKVDLRELRETEGIQGKHDFLEFLLMRSPHGGKDH